MDIKTTEEIVSYGLGTQVASQLSFFPGFSFEALLEGIRDGSAGKLRLPREQISQAFRDINEKLKKGKCGKGRSDRNCLRSSV